MNLLIRKKENFYGYSKCKEIIMSFKKFEKVIELIESFKGKFEEVNYNKDEIDEGQFILPATDELPCLVIEPFNVHGFHGNKRELKGRQDIIKKIKDKLKEENNKMISIETVVKILEDNNGK